MTDNPQIQTPAYLARLAVSQESLRRSLARDRRCTRALVVRYFRDHYGTAWREVMDSLSFL